MKLKLLYIVIKYVSHLSRYLLFVFYIFVVPPCLTQRRTKFLSDAQKIFSDNLMIFLNQELTLVAYLCVL